MKDLNTIKQNTINLLTNSVNEIFTEILESSNSLENLTREIRNKSEQYSKISTEYDEVSKNIKKELQIVARAKGLLKDEEDRFVTGRNSLESEIKELLSIIRNLKINIENLETKKNTINIETKSVDILRSIKENLEKDIAELRLNFKEDTNEYSNTLSIQEELRKDLLLDISDLKKEKEEGLKRVIPTIEELNKRESRVKKREDNINVIERRLKKRYSLR